jgi:hypothetical protein
MACRAARLRARFDIFLAGSFSSFSAFSCIDFSFRSSYNCAAVARRAYRSTAGKFNDAHDRHLCLDRLSQIVEEGVVPGSNASAPCGHRIRPHAWSAKPGGQPSRPEAIRRRVEIGLEVKN